MGLVWTAIILFLLCSKRDRITSFLKDLARKKEQYQSTHNQIMSVLKKLLKMNGPESDEEKLYKVLMTDTYKKGHYQWNDLGEGMESISVLVYDYWKQKYLLDHNRKIATVIMAGRCCWCHFTENDIDWKSVGKLPEEAVSTARQLSAFYPSFIRRFQNGVAEVDWQLIPDGRYWMDDDGYGMTSDVETPVYAMVDRDLNVLVKFQFIDGDYSKLKSMREEAERKLQQQNG